MTDSQAAQMVATLEKIEKHLQAIDWKFWDMHQKFSKGEIADSNKEQPVTVTVEVDSDLETLADIITKVDTTPPVVKHTLKYPSIEILKNE
jgi:hypothetical protein